MKRLLTIFCFFAFLAGCGNDRPAVERQSFMLQVERTGPAAMSAPAQGALRVGRVAVAPPFDERPLVYRRDDVRYETDFYNQFAADPADMLAQALAGWLSQSGLFQRVVLPGGVGTADYRLETSVSALYVDFQAETPAAVLNVRWRLVRDGDGATVVDLDSRQRVPLAERSSAGAARAYRQALQQALGQLEKAVSAALVEGR